eukprot:432757-Ditylum_brightwellii.AAC.1
MAPAAASSSNTYSSTELKFNLDKNNDKAGENVVSMRQLAKKANAGRTFARKIVHNIEKNGVDISGLQRPPKKQYFGVGIKTLSYEDEVFLLDLRKKNARH